MFDFKMRRREEAEKIKSNFACLHPATILTRYTCSNGTIQYVMQCQSCKAKVGNPISHRKLSWGQKKNAPAFDSDGRTKQREAIDYAFKLHRQKFNSDAWWIEYNLYLNSDEWKSKRQQVLIRDEHKCTEGRAGCTRHATEVHHLTYEHVGNEPLKDLTSVCHFCHESITRDSHIEWRTL